jgi:hypothetical protein
MFLVNLACIHLGSLEGAKLESLTISPMGSFDELVEDIKVLS